ncbi:MAG TPA: TolC family protein [Thermoanaerobaculia bacterium]|nr:TolC family protein [Thermoanaerobaculia bacterium]
MSRTIRSVFLLLLAAAATAAAEEGPIPAGQAAATPLNKLVEEAAASNPEIQAAEHGWRAAAEVPKQARALPETQLSIQELSVGSPRPLAGFNNSDFAYVGVGASQDLPYPGKRALRAMAAAHEAESLHEDASAVRRRVVEALKLIYYRLAYVQQTLGILEDNDRLLGQVEQVTESRYGVGQGSQQDVLRAQLQHTKLLQEVAMRHQEEGQLQAQLKQTLNRPQTSPDIVATPLAPTVLRRSDEDFLRQAAEQNPDLRARRESLRGKQTLVELAQREFRPDFNVQTQYQHTGSQFRDYYMASFGIHLPNRGRRAAELAGAEEDRARAEQELRTDVERVASEIAQQLALLRGSEERLKIYDEGLLPQAEATFQAGMAAYQSNRQDFGTLLASFLDVLNLNLERRRELADHESTLARLERLTGATLP